MGTPAYMYGNICLAITRHQQIILKEMGEVAVLTRHLYKSYGKKKTKLEVLKDLDMTVTRGTMQVTFSHKFYH